MSTIQKSMRLKKELVTHVEIMAHKEDRSFNNMVNVIISRHRDNDGGNLNMIKEDKASYTVGKKLKEL